MSKQPTIFDLTRRYVTKMTEKEWKHFSMPVVRKGFRARKGQTTCKPETDKFILKMRRHWITAGTVF